MTSSLKTLLGTQNADQALITGGTIDGAVIGGATPAAATFTTVTSSGAGLNGALGATTPAAAIVTVLTATGAAGAGLIQSGGNITAAGAAQGNATAIVHSIEWVLGANGTKGVILPAAVAGIEVKVKNDDMANAVLKVYPAGNATINALSASSSISMAAKTSAVFICALSGDGGQWATIPLLPS